MQANPRYDAILEYLKEHKRADIRQLQELMYVSEATVRRDLSEMQRLGLLRRVHGGAMYLETSREVAISVRESVNAREKEEAAAVALEHLPEFETLFVDNSSTCLALARRMDLRNKTVVTNGFRIAEVLLEREQARIIMPGGEVRSNAAITGSMACGSLRHFRFDLMLCSCAAIDLSGAYESSLPVRELKAVAMELSDRRFLVADGHKFRQRAPYRVAALGEYDGIFTDAGEERVRPYREGGFPVFGR